eukprot:6477529-Amphidinium_carterae.1
MTRVFGPYEPGSCFFSKMARTLVEDTSLLKCWTAACDYKSVRGRALLDVGPNNIDGVVVLKSMRLRKNVRRTPANAIHHNWA